MPHHKTTEHFETPESSFLDLITWLLAPSAIKINEQDASQLVVQTRLHIDRLAPALVLGILGILLAASATFSSFTCQRMSLRAGKCELVVKRVLGSTTTQFDAADILGVRLEETAEVDAAPSYHVVLQTTQGDIALSQGSERRLQQESADKLLSQINDPARRRPAVTLSTNAGGLAAGLALLALGMVLLPWAFQTTTYLFDKSTDTLTITRRLARTRQQTYRLKDIYDVRVKEDEELSYWSATSIYLFLAPGEPLRMVKDFPHNRAALLAIRAFLGFEKKLA